MRFADDADDRMVTLDMRGKKSLYGKLGEISSASSAADGIGKESRTSAADDSDNAGFYHPRIIRN
jgi:hypothetical protein